jgi:predicted aspartyl protease
MTPLVADRRHVAALLAGAALWPGGRAFAITPEPPPMAPGPSAPAMPGSPPAAGALSTSIGAGIDWTSRMTAPVRIEGQGPFPFVVDTGANRTVIAAELAMKLGLPEGELEPVQGVAGMQMAPTAFASLTVGDRTGRRGPVSLLPSAAIGGQGLLGLDRIGDQCVTLDFHAQQLVIGSAPPRWGGTYEVSVRARRRDGQLTMVDADLAGVPVVAFIDSGSDTTIGNMALHHFCIERDPSVKWLKVPVISATGQTMQAEMADLPHLRVGGFELPVWPVAFVDLHTFSMWGLTERPAMLLGMDVLSRFDRVSLDFARSVVRFRLPQGAI